MALSFYQQEGYLPEVMWNYLLTILNSNYEEWIMKNPDKIYLDFRFSLDKMSNSGALFDLDKLSDISKDILSKMPAIELYNKWLTWAKIHDNDYANVLIRNEDLAIKALSIGKNDKKVRKDLITWKQTCRFMGMYFNEYFIIEDKYPEYISALDIIQFLEYYINELDFSDDKDTWFNKVKDITNRMGYATNMKEYKKAPEAYKGSIVDLTNVLRIAITGRSNAPDILEVSKVLGKECVIDRIRNYIKSL